MCECWPTSFYGRFVHMSSQFAISEDSKWWVVLLFTKDHWRCQCQAVSGSWAAFPLDSTFMKCFKSANVPEKRSFNYSLTCTRRVVKQALGGLPWRCFVCDHNPIQFASKCGYCLSSRYWRCACYQHQSSPSSTTATVLIWTNIVIITHMVWDNITSSYRFYETKRKRNDLFCCTKHPTRLDEMVGGF